MTLEGEVSCLSRIGRIFLPEIMTPQLGEAAVLPNIRRSIIEAKAGLLCRGIQPNDSAAATYQEQNPCGDYKTGNVGLHLLLAGQTYVLATITHRFDEVSPYKIELYDTDTYLWRNNIPICKVESSNIPQWYSAKTSGGVRMANVFLHEGGHFIHQAYQGCDLPDRNLQCMFCGTGEKWKIGSPLDVAETALRALSESDKYHICLGGGTRMPLHRNVVYFEECIRLIREKNVAVPIWVEMAPPDSDDEIDMLIDAGATSFGFNIEIWDDEIRKKFCPGKSEITKHRYISAMSHVLRRLGPCRAGSCLIAGIEPKESIQEGIRVLASEGIQPCILPFKPWDTAALRSHEPCDPAFLIEISTKAVEAIVEFGIFSRPNQGCMLCEGCTIDHDLYAGLLAINEESSECVS